MSTSTIRAEWEGRLIDGKFPLLEWLGGSEDRGVFLTVLQGIKRAAIKLFVAEGEEAEAYLAQWETAKALSHPHLAPILESGRCSIEGIELVYVVTELAERVLSGFIEDRPLRINEARDILEPTLDALSYLHGKGFVHGHIKPSNILIIGGELKISGDDFLLAGGSRERVTNPTIYDAPEVTGDEVSAEADTWSLGMTFSETLMQRPPIWDRSGQLEPIVPDTLPEPFLRIVQGCLRHNPADRCSLENIRERLSSIPEAAAAAEPGVRKPEPVPSRPVPSSPIRPSRPDRYGSPRVAEAHDALSEPAAEPTKEQPLGRARFVEPVAAPPLFADIEEAQRSRNPAALLVIGSLVALGIVAFLLVRAGMIQTWWASWNGPAASQTAVTRTPPVPSTGSQAQPAAPNTSTSQPPSENATPPTTPEASTPQPQLSAPATNASQSAATPGQPAAQPESSTEHQATPAASEPSPTAGQAAPAAALAQPQNGTAAKQIPAKQPAGVPSDGAVANRVLPSVPDSARESMHGPVSVVVRVTANRSGTVEDASYVSPGPGNYFARIAVRAAREWTFTPPNPDGAHPRASVWILHFHFTRATTDVTATREEP